MAGAPTYDPRFIRAALAAMRIGAGAAGGGALLTPVGVWAVPRDADLLACAGALEGGCPNAGTGSDHIALAATFRVADD